MSIRLKYFERIKGRNSLKISSREFFRNTLLIIIMIIPTFIFSCTETGCDIPPLAESRAEENCILTVKLSGIPETQKESPPDDMSVADIFIYNNDALKRLDSYQRVYVKEKVAVKAASCKGKKLIAAIVNPQTDRYDWEDISSFEALCTMTSDLCRDDDRKPLMSGYGTFTAADNSVFELEMTPLLSAIHINSLKCDFSKTSYPSAVLENASVYLGNVNCIAGIMQTGAFSPLGIMNADGVPDEQSKEMAAPWMLCKELYQSIGGQRIYPDIRLSCYPNECKGDSGPGEVFTRLIVAGDIMGTRYYYPININRGEFATVERNAGVSRNCRYVFDLTFKRKGSTDPNIAVSPETVEIFSTIVPWDESIRQEIHY